MTPTAYATAKQVAVSSIPVIDIAPLESGAHADLASVGAQMRAAVEDIGFFYVKNHSVDLMLIEQVNALAHQFFAQAQQAFASARQNAQVGDIIVVFGSFYLVGDIMLQLQLEGKNVFRNT